MINKAIEERVKEKDWNMWVALYPNMDKDTFISFEKFRGTKTEPSKTKTSQEIIDEAEEIRKLHQGTHEGVVRE